MTRKLGERAQDFREQWLAPSGGWLSEVVITISDLTGVWDLIILSGIFVGSWIVLRTSPMEIALILGLGFDLTIPLQYHNDEELSARHEVHLQNYWPTFMIGCIVEGASFFFLHPDLFTLIVCIKTTFMLMMWLSRDQEGLAIKPRRSSGDSDGGSRSGRSSRPREGGSDRHSSRRPSSKDRSSSSSSSAPPPNMPESKNIKDAYKYLKRAGYDDPAIAGMILTLNQADKDKAKQMFKTWAKEKDPKQIARRNAEYAERAKKAGWKPASGSSGSNPPAPPGASKMPESKLYPDAYKYLKKAGYDDAAIAGMIMAMNSSNDKDKAKQLFQTWAGEKNPEEIKRRNQQYTERAKAAGWSGSSSGANPNPTTQSSSSDPNDDGPPNMPTSHFLPTSKAYEILKKVGYDDVAIAGMIFNMNRGDPQQSANNFKIWSAEKNPEEIKRRNATYGKIGQEVGFPDKAKMNALCGPPPGERIKKELGIPVQSVKKLEKLFQQKPFSEQIPKELQQKILHILKNPQSKEHVQMAANTLKKHGIDIKEPEFKDGFGADDGKGGIRDIVLRDDDIKNLIGRMVRKKEFSDEQIGQWQEFLRQPFSRRELEEQVIPFAERVDCFIGEGYHGTGPHRFDPKQLEKTRLAIQAKAGISASMIDHIILKAIYQKDRSQAEAMLNNWVQNGITKEEHAEYSKAVKWA